jgi:hypothetical protein
MSTSNADLSPLLQSVLEQTVQLRQHTVSRGAGYGRAARRVALRNSIYGYTGMLGELGTTFMSKLSATAGVLYGMATVSDVMFGLGLLTALAAGLATQGLTAKRQEKYTDNAIRLDRYMLELKRYEIEIPVIDNANRVKEIKKVLLRLRVRCQPFIRCPFLWPQMPDSTRVDYVKNS